MTLHYTARRLPPHTHASPHTLVTHTVTTRLQQLVMQAPAVGGGH